MYPPRTQHASSQNLQAQKFSVPEACDRIKEELTFLQQHLKNEYEKAMQDKTEMQRHYVMYYEITYGLNVEMHKQTEIAKRLGEILAHHQAQVTAAVERAKQITLSELNCIISMEDAKFGKLPNGAYGMPLDQVEFFKYMQQQLIGGSNLSAGAPFPPSIASSLPPIPDGPMPPVSGSGQNSSLGVPPLPPISSSGASCSVTSSGLMSGFPSSSASGLPGGGSGGPLLGGHGSANMLQNPFLQPIVTSNSSTITSSSSTGSSGAGPPMLQSVAGAPPFLGLPPSSVGAPLPHASNPAFLASLAQAHPSMAAAMAAALAAGFPPGPPPPHLG
ncbi:unnamed protein product, partial [Protopolystoma xenopodis]